MANELTSRRLHSTNVSGSLKGSTSVKRWWVLSEHTMVHKVQLLCALGQNEKLTSKIAIWVFVYNWWDAIRLTMYCALLSFSRNVRTATATFVLNSVESSTINHSVGKSTNGSRMWKVGWITAHIAVALSCVIIFQFPDFLSLSLDPDQTMPSVSSTVDQWIRSTLQGFVSTLSMVRHAQKCKVQRRPATMPRRSREVSASRASVRWVQRVNYDTFIIIWRKCLRHQLKETHWNADFITQLSSIKNLILLDCKSDAKLNNFFAVCQNLCVNAVSSSNIKLYSAIVIPDLRWHFHHPLHLIKVSSLRRCKWICSVLSRCCE